MTKPFAHRWILHWLLILFTAATLAGIAGDSGRILWKPVVEAQLKLDGRPVKTWNVYRAEKKNNLVLVQLERRFLLLDTKVHAVYQLNPTDLLARGKDLESGDLLKQGKPIPSADWFSRDIGPAQLVRLRLLDYGRVLEVQLPHPPDLRGLY